MEFTSHLKTSVRYHPLHEGVHALLLQEPEYLTTLASDVIVWRRRSLLNFREALFVRSFCSPARLEIVALSSLMCFSFVIHEMEMIILICLPHRFVKRINWCLDRVLKPHANIKVTLNRPRGITELSKKKKQLEVELSSCFTAVWVSRLTLCVLLWICRAPVSLFKGVHHGRLLCFKIPFTTQFSCLLPSLSVCKRLSFRRFRELQKCFENPQLQDCFQFS